MGNHGRTAGRSRRGGSGVACRWRLQRAGRHRAPRRRRRGAVHLPKHHGGGTPAGRVVTAVPGAVPASVVRGPGAARDVEVAPGRLVRTGHGGGRQRVAPVGHVVQGGHAGPADAQHRPPGGRVDLRGPRLPPRASAPAPTTTPGMGRHVAPAWTVPPRAAAPPAAKRGAAPAAGAARSGGGRAQLAGLRRRSHRSRRRRGGGSPARGGTVAAHARAPGDLGGMVARAQRAGGARRGAVPGLAGRDGLCGRPVAPRARNGHPSGVRRVDAGRTGAVVRAARGSTQRAAGVASRFPDNGGGRRMVAGAPRVAASREQGARHAAELGEGVQRRLGP